MCDIGELDPCELFNETERTARKVHRCSACRGPIRPGDRYIVHFSIFEGDCSSEKICPQCIVDRAAFMKEHTDGQLCGPSYFATLLHECTDDEESRQKWGPMLAAMKARRNEARP